jgi:hypothetical protein
VVWLMNRRDWHLRQCLRLHLSRDRVSWRACYNNSAYVAAEPANGWMGEILWQRMCSYEMLTTGYIPMPIRYGCRKGSLQI